jgi:hypothetical protein
MNRMERIRKKSKIEIEGINMRIRILAIGLMIVIAASPLPAIAGHGVPPTVIGNRLSFPVIWAEGVEKALPGTPDMDPILGDWVYWWGAPLSCEPDPDDPRLCDDGLEGEVTGDVILQSCEPNPDDPKLCDDGSVPEYFWQPVYPQQNADNTWQAGSVDATTGGSGDTTDETIVIGNDLEARYYASDGAWNVFVVNTHEPLLDGTLTSFLTYNQPGSGPNTFNAYVLRPTSIENQYVVIFDSGPLLVPSVTTGQEMKFPVTPVPVLKGDVIAHYGRGIPLDIGTGTDIISFPAYEAPNQLETINLDVDPFPILPQDRTYSFAAEVNTGGTGGPGGPVVVDWIDWGDSLESQDWNTNSKVRLEVVLLKDLTVPMLQYTMNHISGWGIDEMWGLAATGDPVDEDPGVDAIEGPGTQATVYSHCARLTIQKLLVLQDDERLADLIWVPEDGWTEPEDYGVELINEPIFNAAVHEAEGESSGDYSAEINVKGKIMYGYTWSVRDEHDNTASQAGEGVYRVTFSLDETCGVDETGEDVTRNTDFVDPDTQIFLPIEVIEEEEAVTLLAESDDSDGGDTGGGVAVIDYDNDLTYIDLNIELKENGKKGRK